MGLLASIFSNKILLGVGVALALVIGWKYIDLKSTIAEQEETIERYKEKNLILQVDIQTEQYNVEKLKNTIEALNLSISKIELKNQEIQETYNTFKSKALEDKYNNAKVIDVMKSRAETCEEGLRINKIISGMKYEELE